MAATFMNDIRGGLKNADTLQRLLVVNVIIFLLINVAGGILGLFMISLNRSAITEWLAVPASVDLLITRPWTLVTYMFLHIEFFHILFNMLWLYWIGKIFLEYLGPKKLFSTYILGGISGAILYIIAFNVFPLFSDAVESSSALGASASVLAIIVGTATLLPDYPISVFFIRIPLKYIALISILMDLISVSGNNAGGHIAHLGGALFGFVYIRQLKNGTDIAAWFNKFMDKLHTLIGSGRSSRMKVKYRRTGDDQIYNSERKSNQERVDEILDKISKSGYGSLTKDEKDFLFKSSKNN